MALVRGRDGVVKVGANTLARVQSFNFNFSLEKLDGTSMGDSNKVYVLGDTEISGDIVVKSEPGDTAQEALEAAAIAKTEVTLELYDEGGTDAGKRYWTGPAVIDSFSMPVERSGLIEKTFTWASGDGSWTRETVS